MSSVVQAITLLYASAAENQHFCVAYSGGIDSHVLLSALVQLKPASVQLRAIHIHHGLQTMADAWAEHCAEQAKILKVPLQIKHVDAKAEKGQSPEAAAREARYAALSETLQEGEILFTAHNQNDQAETFLLQLLRGAGVKGLAAMPAQIPFARGKLYRPLLEVSRAAISDYAHQQHLSWIEDPSNDNTQFDRNFLRQKIMPTLMERWPSVTQTIARSARHCAQAWDLIEAVVEQDYNQILSHATTPIKNCPPADIKTLSPVITDYPSDIRNDSSVITNDSCVITNHPFAITTHPFKSSRTKCGDPENINSRLPALSIEKLLVLSIPRQHQVLRYWLESQQFSLPSTAQLQRIFQDLIHAAADKKPLMRWPGVELRRFKGYLYAMQPLESFDSKIELTWDGRSSLRLPADLGELDQQDPRLEPIQSQLSSTQSPIKIRFRQGGETMRVKGRKGRRELKKLFQEWQVLPWRRDRIPLIYVDDELSLVLLSAQDTSAL